GAASECPPVQAAVFGRAEPIEHTHYVIRRLHESGLLKTDSVRGDSRAVLQNVVLFGEIQETLALM
ncbi:MAG: hypothetical protein RML32_05000, partial [Gammaproteobacteria bacterium]|nr:hypothetical protein [Gammaproteobacteria bacterium]